jgi:60 kDa SS-A/Ro ribonucleoprotein
LFAPALTLRLTRKAQMDAYGQISTRQTPQSEKADSRQVPNSAGGYVFAVTDEARLRRFLILGSEGGTYYASAKDATVDNAGMLKRMAAADPIRMVEVIREISVAGRAPKANPALLALALVAGAASTDGRKAALDAVPEVVRTGTHLLTFVRYLKQFRGMGRGAKRAVAGWFLDRDASDLAYQVVKYRQREGWSMRDVLRVAHPKASDPGTNAVLGWATNPDGVQEGAAPALIGAWRALQAETLPVRQAVAIIEAHPVSWEMLPDRLLSERDAWCAMVDKGMPQTALMRQLPRLTNLGMLDGQRGKAVSEQLADPARLRRARVHPINVLVAQRTYASGHGARGAQEWTPNRRVVDALDAAFYGAFGAVEPTGRRTMLALDVSGSMAMCPIANLPLTPREASAAMALVTASVEDDYEIVGFTSGGSNRGFYMHGGFEVLDGLAPLSISPRQRLDDAIRAVSNLSFGGTDCALPMLHALKRGMQIDTFVIYTDSETWSGTVHPHQALERYRQKTGIDARVVVVGMTSTGFSIADPADAGMLDVVGFDSAVPNLISEFARGL